jgi:hypothetical protein
MSGLTLLSPAWTWGITQIDAARQFVVIECRDVALLSKCHVRDSTLCRRPFGSWTNDALSVNWDAKRAPSVQLLRSN